MSQCNPLSGGLPIIDNHVLEFVSRNEHRDIVLFGLGRQPGEDPGLECVGVTIFEGVVGTILNVDGWSNNE